MALHATALYVGSCIAIYKKLDACGRCLYLDVNTLCMWNVTTTETYADTQSVFTRKFGIK